MARIRTIKPEFFRHGGLFDAERETGLPLRLAFAGLWTVADREGRFPWNPRAIKLDCLPYDECDFGAVMEALDRHGFIKKYEAGGEAFGYVLSWKKHQVINQREAQSAIPPPAQTEHVHARAAQCAFKHVPNGVNLPAPLRETVIARDGGKCLRCGAAEDLTIDHIFPQCIGGTHAITNLRCLCRACNSGRPIGGDALLKDLARDGLCLDDMQRMCMHMPEHVPARGEGKGKGREGDSAADSSSATPAPVASIPLVDGSEFDISAGQVDEWTATFPAVDVVQKLREMRAWCVANPSNRKTRSGVLRFCVRWLSQEQNKAPRINGSHAAALSGGDPFRGAV